MTSHERVGERFFVGRAICQMRLDPRTRSESFEVANTTRT